MPTIPERTRDFLAALDDIDLRNADYFIFQPVAEEAERDKLKNHCFFEVDKGKAMFKILPKSDLPYHIRKSCVAKFSAFFPDGEIVGGINNSLFKH